MPYTNVDIFLEKGVKSVGESLNFMEKRVKKNHSRLFLFSFDSKLSQFNKNLNLNLNLNHKWAFTNLEKPMWHGTANFGNLR
jgi:hypothetical protein